MKKLNSRGALAVDMIFGLTLIVGIMIIVFSIAYTLSIVETLQYMAFATSRTYFAGHIDPDTQSKLAKDKFTALSQKPGIKNLLKPSWVLAVPAVGDFKTSYDGTSRFMGAQIAMTAKFLDFSLPFWGNTSENSGGFKATLTSYLGREPSSNECQDFFAQRFEKLTRVPVNSGAAYSLVKDGKDNLPLDDNGC